MLPTWTKVTKSRFNEMQSIITKGEKSKLKIKIDIKKITLKYVEKLLKDIQ